MHNATNSEEVFCKRALKVDLSIFRAGLYNDFAADQGASLPLSSDASISQCLFQPGQSHITCTQSGIVVNMTPCSQPGQRSTTKSVPMKMPPVASAMCWSPASILAMMPCMAITCLSALAARATAEVSLLRHHQQRSQQLPAALSMTSALSTLPSSCKPVRQDVDITPHCLGLSARK